MKQLYEVYENNIDEVGKFSIKKNGQVFTLLPISHVTQSAQIEVVIDENGDLFHAEVLEKNRARTIVPATLDSANRAGAKVAPHYLHDKLFYVAGDYMKYGGDKKRAENYSNYILQMKEWALASNSHPKVKIVYEYLKKGCLIEDLVAQKILFVDDHNHLIEKWNDGHTEKYNIDKPQIFKEVTGNSSDAFIRFTILADQANDVPTWENLDLFKNYQNYLSEKMQVKMPSGYCYITGETSVLTDKHGSKLRNAGDMSKLISSNDKQGFTYRGRFEKPEHAVQIGYDVSQKAHNALRWLNERQGYQVDSRYFVTFGIEKPGEIQTFDGSFDLIEKELLDFFGEDTASVDKDLAKLTIAQEVQKALVGKKHNFEIAGIETIVVMAVDAATTGRLAIIYYQQLASEFFLKSLSNWHSTCKWYQDYYAKEHKQFISFIGTPSTYHIVEAVYGEKADSRIKKELYTRILPCIVEEAKIPKDIIQLILNRIKNPFSFNSLQEWSRTINIACALIHREYEEGIEVGLDIENETRDYLFGRLLGIAEAFESNELKRKDEKRATNATRYFNAFTQHPARVWLAIQKQLHPYKVRPSEYSQRYIRMLQEIESKIKPEDMNNKPLGPQFLLGYSSQIRDFYIKKEEKEGIENGTN